MPSFTKPTKKRRSVYPVVYKADATKCTSYINLTVCDASDAVYNQVYSKVSATQTSFPGPKKFKEKVAHAMAKTASTKVPKSVIVKAMAEKLPKMLMYKLHSKMGMRLAAQAVYREDNFVVIQIQVQYVDSKRLLAKAKEDMGKSQPEGEEEDDDSDDESVATAVLDEWIAEQKNLAQEEQESPFVTNSKLEEEEEQEEIVWSLKNWREVIVMVLAWILTKLIPCTVTRDLEESKLPSLIQAQITSNMKDMLDQKLSKMELHADTAVLGEADQARYFFSHLQDLRSRGTTGTTIA